jgi:hypothetical protein
MPKISLSVPILYVSGGASLTPRQVTTPQGSPKAPLPLSSGLYQLNPGNAPTRATLVGGQSAQFPYKNTLRESAALLTLTLSFLGSQRFRLIGDISMSKPTDALLRRYAVNRYGVIHFLETSPQPGWFLAERLNHVGQPLNAQLVPMREIKRMSLHSELRSARSQAGANHSRYGQLVLGPNPSGGPQ